MPQRPIEEYWKNKVKEHLTASNGAWGNRKIYRLLEVEGEKLSNNQDPKYVYLATRYPSERSIARIRAEWIPESDAKKAGYGLFYWPASMESLTLPWEASSAALELLGVFHQIGRDRPSVRLARWFWKISIAAPGLQAVLLPSSTFPAAIPLLQKMSQVHLPGSSWPDRIHLASLQAAWETLGAVPDNHQKGVEMYLAFAPWRGVATIDYVHGIRIGTIPPVPPLDFLDPKEKKVWEDVYGKSQIEIWSGMEKRD